MKNYEINLDLDGTPVELIPSALKVQGYDLKTVLVSWKRIRPGELIPLISVEKNPVSSFKSEALEPEKFWGSIQSYNWISSLYRALSSFRNVMSLIEPFGDSGCLAGEYHSLQNHSEANFSEHICIKHKDKPAHEKAILIDNMPFNISGCKAREGETFLLPTVWKTFYSIYVLTECVLADIKRAINR